MIIGASELSAQIYFIELQSASIAFGNTIVHQRTIERSASDTIPLNADFEPLQGFFENISQNLTEEKPKILFFLHGMWESKPTHFKEAYEYLDRSYLKNTNSSIGAIVIITWDASDFFYKSVQKSGLSVVPTFQVLLHQMAHFQQKQSNISLNLLCHSLGNLILHESLQSEYPTIFDKLIQSAPDMPLPHDKNQVNYQNIEKIATDILMLANKKDKALLFSGIINKHQRVGRKGLPKDFQTKIKVQEVSQFKDTQGFYPKISNHMQFRCSASVAKIMVDFFNK